MLNKLIKFFDKLKHKIMRFPFKILGIISRKKLIYGERYYFEQIGKEFIVTYQGGNKFMMNHQYMEPTTGTIIYGSKPRIFTDEQLGVLRIKKYENDK